RTRPPRHELARGVPLSSPVSVRLGPLPHRGAPAAGGPRARPVGSLLAGGKAGAPEREVSDLVEVEGLVKHYRGGGGWLGLGARNPVRAVDGVSFSIAAGRTLALVGET